MHRMIVYLAVTIATGVFDLVWLGLLMQGFYSKELGPLARRSGERISVNIPAAVLVYVLIPLGIVLFVLPQLRAQPTTFSALCWGAAFGLVVYGVYDLTNYAILAGWSLRMTVVDLVWGCVLCGLASVVGLWAERWMASS
jgi:uncharacterized membrane protein